MGRIGVDLYPLQIGVSLRGRRPRSASSSAAAPTNVAVAAARLRAAGGGRSPAPARTRSASTSTEALRGFGVDDRYVTPVAGLPTPVTFCEIFPPDDFPLYFYRVPKAPDLEIHADELDLDAIARRRHLLGHRSPGCRRSRAATAHARRAGGARTRRHHRARPRLPADVLGVARGGAAAQVRAALAARRRRRRQPARSARSRSASASRTRPPQALLDAGVELAVVKQGPAGVLGRATATSGRGAPVPVEVVNGLGAGDAFGGALCHGLLAGWELERIAPLRQRRRRASSPSRLACADAMPTDGRGRGAARRSGRDR